MKHLGADRPFDPQKNSSSSRTGTQYRLGRACREFRGECQHSQEQGIAQKALIFVCCLKTLPTIALLNCGRDFSALAKIDANTYSN